MPASVACTGPELRLAVVEARTLLRAMIRNSAAT